MTLLSRLAVFGLIPAAAFGADRTCSTATSLDELITCIRTQMPKSGSGGFVAPTTAQQDDWRWTVRMMLHDSCNFTLPASLAGIMQVRSFTDSTNQKTYCLLMEVRDANNDSIVDRGWGTFIVDPGAQREISHQAPHPLYDLTTELEAVGIFRDTNSRSFLMCGAHRNANPAASTCQSAYQAADCAHNTANMFQATVLELQAFYAANPWNAIQWHGMAADSCAGVDAFLSHGPDLVPAASDRIVQLRNNVVQDHPTWQVALSGSGACDLTGGSNVQGRLLNGVAEGSVCTTAAQAYTGIFIHNEQDPLFRTPADWVSAVSRTWSATVQQPPSAPTGLTATGGKRKITLAWAGSAGAASYTVKRSAASGGPYSAIASGVTATTWTNAGLKTGTTWYYVVAAVNSAGTSANSAEARATVR